MRTTMLQELISLKVAKHALQNTLGLTTTLLILRMVEL